MITRKIKIKTKNGPAYFAASFVNMFTDLIFASLTASITFTS